MRSFERGGYLPPGLSLAYNGTGRPEPVGGATHVTYNISISAPLSVNRAQVGREVVHAIKEYERSSGNGWRR